MGYDELLPVSRLGRDGLRGLGATVVDAFGTTMILGLDDVVAEAESWIEKFRWPAQSLRPKAWPKA